MLWIKRSHIQVLAGSCTLYTEGCDIASLEMVEKKDMEMCDFFTEKGTVLKKKTNNQH